MHILLPLFIVRCVRSSFGWASFSWTSFLLRSLLGCCALLWCTIGVLLVPPLASAQEVAVPVKIHVSLLKKVFTLSKNLQGKQVKVVIAFGGTASAVKDEVLSSFLAIGIQASACKVAQLPQEAADADVIYIAPGGDAAEQFCLEKGILSMTGIPLLTETGKATISVGMEAGKPKVFIHRNRAKQEKQEFSADLFRLSRLF